VLDLEGKRVSVVQFQKQGFHHPIHVADSLADLELKVPNGPNFGLSDIRALVGSRRSVQVRSTPLSTDGTAPIPPTLSMTMKEWHKYFDEGARPRDRLLLVDALEFSHTKLDGQVVAPKVVRDIDWVETAWPPYFKSLQFEPTNAADEMMYPKVSQSSVRPSVGRSKPLESGKPRRWNEMSSMTPLGFRFKSTAGCR
jgi:hypothetical protein